jgi:CheY-specific phosphatase CheX
MAEWFRGVAFNGPPAQGGQVNDLGPGTYFTDQLADAQYYAQFRARPTVNDSKLAQESKVPVVFSGDIGNEMIGRVLDLTSGPEGQAWSRFEKETIPSGSLTNLEMMSMSPKNYGSMFERWAKKNDINLDTYSAIIGPHYVGGKITGKQMCVRSSEIANKIVSKMDGYIDKMPKAPFIKTAIPSVNYSIRGQANGAALTAVAMIVDTAQSQLNSYFQEEWAKQAVNADMNAVRAWQKDNPGDGALIVTTFKRVIINSEYMQNKTFIQPGDAFEFNSIYYGATPEEAGKVMSKTQELVQGDTIDGPYRTVRRKQAIWVVPRLPTSQEVTTLPGRWNVTIGNWKGVFGFSPNGDCYWKQGAEAAHTGTWKVVGAEFQWTFSDDPPGWERVFHAAIPLKKSTSGTATIKGVNHGFYNMVKQ